MNLKRWIFWLLSVALLCGACVARADDGKGAASGTPADEKKAEEKVVDEKKADEKKADEKKPDEKKCDPETQPVEVETAGDGWLVLREACEDETDAWLTYTINGQAGRPVSGQRKEKGKWAFVVTEKIPTDAIVELDFGVVQKLAPASIEEAKKALRQFRDDLDGLIRKSFDEAVVEASAGAVSEERRLDLLMLSFKDRLRKQVSALLVKAKLNRFYLKDKPATDALLEKAHFRKIGEGEWEPLPEVLDDLRKAADADARALWNAVKQLESTDALIEQKKMSSPVCSGDRKVLRTKDAVTRGEVVAACLKALAASANALPPLKDAAAQEQRIKDTKTVEEAAGNVDAAIPKGRSGANGSASLFDSKTEQALDRLLTMPVPAAAPAPDKAAAPAPGKAPQPAGDKKPPKSSAELKSEIADALNGANYAAALLVEATQRETLEKRAGESFQVKDAELGELHEFVRKNRASEFVRVPPAKPRFFVSTGFVATGLNAHPMKWKLSLPVLVSICWSAHGCETKGTYEGSFWNYVSTDVGVKVTFIGAKDPRESVPSFLVGLGVTPFYATHLSAGVNLFENPQAERVNAAFYAALTIDLLNGGDILGALGLAKPEPQVLGGKKEQPDENATKEGKP